MEFGQIFYIIRFSISHWIRKSIWTTKNHHRKKFFFSEFSLDIGIYFTNLYRNLLQLERAQARLKSFSYLCHILNFNQQSFKVIHTMHNIGKNLYRCVKWWISLFSVESIHMKIILNNNPGKVPRLNLTSLQSLQFLRVCTSQYHWKFQFLSHI